MESPKKSITIRTTINAPVDKVWKAWTTPDDIIKWNSASDDWHTPRATNDLRVGGSFTSRMESKDGSMGFDFGGTYLAVDEHKTIEYIMSDDRKVKVTFEGDQNQTNVTETFDAEETNPLEMQRDGWQSILNNFKSYVEGQN